MATSQYKYTYLVGGKVFIIYAPTKEDSDKQFQENFLRTPTEKEYVGRDRW